MCRRLYALIVMVAVAGCAQDQDPAAVPPTTEVTTPETTGATSATTTTAPTATTTTLARLTGLAYEEVASLDFPVQMTALPGAEIAYVATKDGRVWAYDGVAVSEEPVLDISASVTDRGEQGLLSIVLHPEDPGRLFAHYSDREGDTVVSEFRLDDPMVADPASERVLLTVDQPASNHNGGMLQFGPDGRLYLGLGDGGGADDQFGNAQDTTTLLGGLVVIDVDQPDPALFQYGLRNPWRFWIEGELIYLADVGQDAFEEVNVAPLEHGINYGWPIMEGLHCFQPPVDCDTSGLTLPVVEVAHGDAGTCSITGGIVYRGPAIPEIAGHFFYSDYCGGYLRSFRWEGGEVAEEVDWTGQMGVPGQVVSFGVDGAGEMYVATTDRLLKVTPRRG